MSLNSSHGRGWEEDAVKQGGKPHGDRGRGGRRGRGMCRGSGRQPGAQRVVFVPYHTANHLDCRVQPQPTPEVMSPDAAQEDSQCYIRNKFPNMVTLTFPGLNRNKIKNNEVIPSGRFKGFTPREALLKFTKARMASLVLASNDSWILSKPTDDAIQAYFQMINGLFTGTCFKILFISTMFPRRSFYKNGHINSAVVNFNLALLQKHKKYEKISGPSGETVLLGIRIVDMTSSFPYEAMDHPRYYCSRSRDGIHLKGIYSEIYLNNLFAEIRKYQDEYSKKSKKKKIKLDGASRA